MSAGADSHGHGAGGGSRVRSRSVGDEELNQSARTLGGGEDDGGGVSGRDRQVSKDQD